MQAGHPPSQPYRVAIIGAGPAGFYAAEQLLRQEEFPVEVDLFDRLPTPYGLVRYGVAPDHEKIRNVIRMYERTASRPGFRFFGNVAFGEHLGLDDLRTLYHAVIFTTGAQVDRTLGIPGENLAGSHSATEFVAWYNGHPDYRDRTFDLEAERVAIIGVGNVAVDVARILCRTPEELAATDIADEALEALRHSRVREVYLLGRRGPAQAAFTYPEAKELGELAAADVYVPPEEATLDPLSQADLEAQHERDTIKKVELIQDFARRRPTGKPKRLVIRFLVSPVEILDDGTGHVGGLRLVRNELYRAENGALRPRPTGVHEDLPADLVFRSIGYRGVPLPGLPFDERRGILPNEHGRLVDPATGEVLTGLYAAGWIKRGPTGVIGTNKSCAVETVEHLLADLRAGRHLIPERPSAEAAGNLIRARQPEAVSFEDWKRLDRLETERGQAQGRPRVKFTDVEAMLAALRQSPTDA
ncbi:MAG: NADP oxidoreductase [Rhodothermaceae bacterium]|nr:MAG: NADP oxidoreductase [Rhodothermaceae bacterium]